MSWKDALSAVAPTLATALGGPFAGAAAKFALDKLGVTSPESTDEAISELEKRIVGASPAELAELKKIDNEFAIQMEELGIKREQLILQDRQNARDLAKIDMRPHMVMSAVFVIGYFTIAVLDGLGKFDIDPVIFGVMTAAMPMILQFWFGSSHGSKQKTASMTKNGGL